MSWSTYPLRSGAQTEHGIIEQVSMTAYLIGGVWMPHHKIHGPREQAEALVVIA